MNLQRVKALTRKELLRVVREPANLFLVLVFPLVLTLAFGVAFGAIGSGGDIQYTVGVVDNDASLWSVWLQGNITETAALVVSPYDDHVSAYADLETGKVSAVLVIPKGFGGSMESFIANPVDSNSWEVSTLDLGLDQGSLIVGSVLPAFIQQALTVTMYGEAALSHSSPVVIGTPTMVDSVKLSQFDYMVPGMFSFAAIFISMIVAQVFTEERASGILSRIAITPTTSSDIFMGLICANMITSVVQVLVVLGTSYLMGFRPMGGVLGTIVATIAVLLLVLTNVGLGLITATIAKTSGTATGMVFIFILPQMFLGSFVPAPESVSRFVPSYYVTETLTSVFLRGAEVTSFAVLSNLAVLAAFGFVVVGLGVTLFNRYGRK
jgi:ABC-type multidrug transport system permease subunit